MHWRDLKSPEALAFWFADTLARNYTDEPLSVELEDWPKSVGLAGYVHWEDGKYRIHTLKDQESDFLFYNMLHELGHILAGHVRKTPGLHTSRPAEQVVSTLTPNRAPMEAEADEFARAAYSEWDNKH